MSDDYVDIVPNSSVSRSLNVGEGPIIVPAPPGATDTSSSSRLADAGERPSDQHTRGKRDSKGMSECSQRRNSKERPGPGGGTGFTGTGGSSERHCGSTGRGPPANNMNSIPSEVGSDDLAEETGIKLAGQNAE